MPGGKVSNHIVRLLMPGSLVHLDQAAGDFVLPQPLPDQALFLTAGSGVTPVMGLLRTISRTCTTWSSSTPLLPGRMSSSATS